MRFSLAIILAVLLAEGLASPVLNHVVHGKLDNRIPEGYHKLDGKLKPDTKIPIRIALRQTNLHRANEFLMDVSDPKSANYGKHWSKEKVAETFAPVAGTIERVKDWLQSEGISESRITLSKGKNYIKFDSTVGEAQKLLKNEYHAYQHEQTGAGQIVSDDYKVPAHVSYDIDFVSPTVQFSDRQKVGNSRRFLTPPKPNKPSVGKRDLSNCANAITPECLRALYGFETPTSATEGNSMGCVEYSPNSYIQTDLDSFFEQFQPSASGAAPQFVSYAGGTLNNDTNQNDHLESDLDLEYAIANVNPIQFYVYEIGGDQTGTDFFDALDDYAKVLSISYDSTETGGDPAAQQAECNEYMKLGLQGTSVVYSSGDFGIGGLGQCPTADDGSVIFVPTFPSTCPYITSVGATQIVPDTTIGPTPSNGTSPEQACATVISSGGGFSNVFGIPDYQRDAVSSYFQNHAPPFSSSQFNDSQATRGFPDVAANGAFYQTVTLGSVGGAFGTSASAPTFGSLLTLINNVRLANGDSTVGFVNPTLYANPQMFYDVTQGSNPGCNTDGFDAVEGWDPVTGLGTPNYQAMLSVFTSQ